MHYFRKYKETKKKIFKQILALHKSMIRLIASFFELIKSYMYVLILISTRTDWIGTEWVRFGGRE